MSQPSAWLSSPAAALRILPESSVLLLTPHCRAVPLFLYILVGDPAPSHHHHQKDPKLFNSWDPGICSSTKLTGCPGENPKADFSPVPRTGVRKPPLKQQGKFFSEQEERAELMPSAPWQTCQQASSLGRCYSLKAKLDICGAHLQLLVIPLACAGLARCPRWEFPYHISPSRHKGPFMEQASSSASPSFLCQPVCPEQGCAPLAPSLPCKERCWKRWL